MSPLKLVIPLFIVLGLLQVAVLALPLIYWRFQAYMGPINKFLFGSVLLFIAFVIHPLILITLITFTIAPTLLSLRLSVIEKMGTLYMTCVPQHLPALPHLPSISNLDKGLPKNNREWLMTLLGGYAGWKVLGTLPSLVILGWLANKGLRGAKVEEKGVGVRSERTDVQVVG